MPVSADAPLTRSIPSSGERIPVMGMGTWRVFDVGHGPSARAPLDRCVAAFESLGGRVIDTSPMYGWAEEVAGEILTSLGLHDRMFIATKVWTQGRERGIEQMRESMRKLGVDRVDLMQVHNLVDASTHLDTLRRWKAEGLVRYIGVTHYSDRAHADVARVLRETPLDFVQINYSVAERAAEQSILPLAAERGVAVIANRPLAAGAALGPLRERPVPEWAAELGCTTWSQLLLKFVVSHPAVTCAIPATSNPDHLLDNMRAASGPMPDASLRERIARAATER
ncbi:MAG TPA: aldo/keto reductase [Gemmatimonadaceae bacterium]|nr:aldo/keto reductase [Gemmatimonadaceae bacterium]